MKLYDICIAIFLLICAITGFKRGVFKSIIMFVGAILVLVFAYQFKNIVGDFFVLNLPFFKFSEFLGGASSLNILMYQTFAFLLMIIIFSLVYRLLLAITGLFEKVLKFTIILGIPSKILGLIFGLLEGYIIVYMVLFFLVQPFINLDIYNQSDYAKGILEKTPILSGYAEKTLQIYNEVIDLKDIDNQDELDAEMINLIIKNNVTSVDIIEKLQDMKKINISNLDTIIDKYKEVNDD